ncbi:unnamed protein product, partial [Phaeothamnion confervicola]
MPDNDDGMVAAGPATTGRNTSDPRPIHCMARLIREGAMAGIAGRSGPARSHVQKMLCSLGWRQAYNHTDEYLLPLLNGRSLCVKQLLRERNLGTGATVWPAAVVLIKHLERRFGAGGMAGLRGVDLGAGTGIVGLAAAGLGADVVLTDQEQLGPLMRENAAAAIAAAAAAAAATAAEAGTPPSPSPSEFMTAPTLGSVAVASYDWGGDDAPLRPLPLDFVLASDVILPQQYPIEPLATALDRLSGPQTLGLVAYEHRHYSGYDPRDRFRALCKARGLTVTPAGAVFADPLFCADDIEVWEVRRRQNSDGNGERDGGEEGPGAVGVSAMINGTEAATGAANNGTLAAMQSANAAEAAAACCGPSPAEAGAT